MARSVREAGLAVRPRTFGHRRRGPGEPAGSGSSPGPHSTIWACSPETIEPELIRPSGFYQLAQSGDYPEAIAALLDTTDRWIGSHDATTRLPVAQVQVPAAVASPGAATATGRGGRDRPARCSPSSRPSSASSGSSTDGPGAALDRRIKEVRSRATDVMDHLDALKERLKLLPTTDPDFRTPMSGETEALYATLQQAVGKLWDRWLQVMESLDRRRSWPSASPRRSRGRHCTTPRPCWSRRGRSRRSRRVSKSCSADMDRLNQAHEAARAEREAAGGAIAKLDERIQGLGKLGLPVDPYQQISARARGGPGPMGWADRVGPDRRPIGGSRPLAPRPRSSSAGWSGSPPFTPTPGRSPRPSRDCGGRSPITGRRACGSTRRGAIRMNPLARADEAHAGAVKALEAGDPDAAATGLETARSMVEQARGTIEQVRDARDYCRREQPERVARHRSAPGRDAARGGGLSTAGARVRARLVGGRGAQPRPDPRGDGLLRRDGGRGRRGRVRPVPALPGRRPVCSASSPSSSRPRSG